MVKLTVQFELPNEWDSFGEDYPDKDLRDRCLIEELLYHIKFENDIYKPDIDIENSITVPIKVIDYE